MNPNNHISGLTLSGDAGTVCQSGTITETTDYIGPYELENGQSRRLNLPGGYITLTDSVYHHYIPDYQGNILAVVNTRTRQVEQRTNYYPYGLPHGNATGAGVNRRKYSGKELITFGGYDAMDYHARWRPTVLPLFTTPDPLGEDFTNTSLYMYCGGDPVNNVDPSGMAVVYSPKGDYLGSTQEGFTGRVYIYYGTNKPDFSKMSASQMEDKYDDKIFYFDDKAIYLTGKTQSKIWTHIISQFEGMMVYDEKFSMNSLYKKRIHYNSKYVNSNWGTSKLNDQIYIYGSGKSKFAYETTIENLASSIIVHEWYSHGMKGNRSSLKSHRLAYKNVINFKALWDKTTENFKEFNLKMLMKYITEETGRTGMDYLYQNLYQIYVK